MGHEGQCWDHPERKMCVCIVWKDVDQSSCELLSGNIHGAHGTVFKLRLDTW